METPGIFKIPIKFLKNGDAWYFKKTEKIEEILNFGKKIGKMETPGLFRIL